MANEHQHQWIETEEINEILSKVFPFNPFEVVRLSLCRQCLFLRSQLITILNYEQARKRQAAHSRLYQEGGDATAPPSSRND